MIAASWEDRVCRCGHSVRQHTEYPDGLRGDAHCGECQCHGFVDGGISDRELVALCSLPGEVGADLFHLLGVPTAPENWPLIATILAKRLVALYHRKQTSENIRDTAEPQLRKRSP